MLYIRSPELIDFMNGLLVFIAKYYYPNLFICS